MNKEEKELLSTEIDNIRKSVGSLGWQMKYWASKEAEGKDKNAMQALTQVTGQFNATSDYLKWLEQKMK